MQTHIAWILFYNFLLATIGVSIELYFSRKIKFRNYDRRETIVSMIIFTIATYSTLYSNQLTHFYGEFSAQHAFFDLHENTFWTTILAFFVGDFIYYWLHRYSHEVRLGWATHIVHHTPEKLNISASYRIAATGLLSFFWLAYPLMLLIGFSSKMMFFWVVAGMVYQFWIHTDVIPKLGWFEWIFNTPSHHRVHHATNKEYIDCNYGGILIIFDRMFGTYRADIPGVEIKYGVTEKIESQNPIYLIFVGWIFLLQDLRKYPGIKNAVNLIFRGPGWAPQTSSNQDQKKNRKIS